MAKKILDRSNSNKVRDAKDIAFRILALFGVVGVAFGAPRKDVISWLKDESLWIKLEPSEVLYLSMKRPTRKHSINASWKSEALIVLLWALSKVEKLPEPNEQCDTSLFQRLLPPYSTETVEEFVSRAKRRSDTCLVEMADNIKKMHWTIRNAKSHAERVSQKIDIEIIQERHLAINWVIGYEGLPWDEVTTDT